MDQQIVRLTLARLDNSEVTMSERIMPEPDAFETFQGMVKELTGRVIKHRPLTVSPAGTDMVWSRGSRVRWRSSQRFLIVATCMAFSFLIGYVFDHVTHCGWQRGCDRGAYGTK